VTTFSRFVIREVERIVSGTPVSDGGGVRLLRVLTPDLQRRFDPFAETEKPACQPAFLCSQVFDFGGEGGIRTPGRESTVNGFQDRRFKPLSHLSSGHLEYPIGRPGSMPFRSKGTGHWRLLRFRSVFQCGLPTPVRCIG
jgi:hypothetical protein